MAKVTITFHLDNKYASNMTWLPARETQIIEDATDIVFDSEYVEIHSADDCYFFDRRTIRSITRIGMFAEVNG